MKLWIAMLLIVTLIVAAGCGQSSGPNEANDGNNEVDENPSIDNKGSESEQDRDNATDKQDLPERNFYAVTSIIDLAREFEELECKVQDFQMGYYFLGQSPVNGDSGEHIRIVADNTEYEVWLDDEGELMKAKVQGEEIPKELAFQVLYLFSLLDVLLDEQEWNNRWDGAEQRIETRDLGFGPIQVTRLEWRMAMVPTYLEIEVAEVAGRSLITALWHMNNNGEPITGWIISRVLPR